MTVASLIAALIAFAPGVDSDYVESSGKEAGKSISSAIKFIEVDIDTVSDSSATLGGGSSSGLEKDMVFEIRGSDPPVILKIVDITAEKATAKRLSGRDYPTEWKGKKVVESPTIAVGGVYDEMIEGFDDFSRDFSSGVLDAFKSAGFKDLAPLEAVEPVASDVAGPEAKELKSRKGIYDATGANIIVLGWLTREQDRWVVKMEAVNATSGAVRGQTSVSLDLSKLDSYQAGALLYEFQQIESDSSRRVLSGALKVGHNDRTGKSGLMPGDGRFLLALSQRVFGSVYDVTFKWQSNRLAPPVNPPGSQTTLVLHYKDLNNWDGVRFSTDKVMLIGMENGKQWLGKESATLKYPMIDSDEGSTLTASVVGKKVRVKVGDTTIRTLLPTRFPARVGFSCINEVGDDPRNTFLVHSCVVKRGSGL